MSIAATTIQDCSALRNQKGISLRQISDSTKIGMHYLEAIEDGQFTKLPGGIYSVSYIRQYARAIQMPEEVLLDYYLRAALSPEKTTYSCATAAHS